VRPAKEISVVGTKNLGDCCPPETLRLGSREVVINPKAAKASGVQISDNLLSLAHAVIE
jgi:hypothetical protein